jgi:hypothetical protein
MNFDEVQAEIIREPIGHNESIFKIRIYSPVARKVVFTNDGQAVARLDLARDCVQDWAVNHHRKVILNYVGCE